MPRWNIELIDNITQITIIVKSKEEIYNLLEVSFTSTALLINSVLKTENKIGDLINSVIKLANPLLVNIIGKRIDNITDLLSILIDRNNIKALTDDLWNRLSKSQSLTWTFKDRKIIIKKEK